VLRPGGEFIGMLYARRSLVTLRFWLRHALLTGRPWRSPADVIWHHMESTGTRCYSQRELRRMFAAFGRVETRKIVTPYDTADLPRWLAAAVPEALGWNIVVRASK
jgi:hypothetical protein